MRIGCIVLAAGKSSRFGANKLLEDLNGIPVLARTLRAVPAKRFEKCACVCASAEVEELARGCGFPAKRYAGGALSDSIRTGLAEMPELDGWMFVNGDQPLLQRSSLLDLIAAFEENPQAVCRLSYAGAVASPALFPAAMREELMQLRGERGGMSAAKECGAQIVPVEASRAEELWDTDDRAMLMRARDFLIANPRFEKE